MNETMQTVLAGIIRHAITSAGGALIAHGYLTGSDVNALAGALALIIGLAWSVFQKWQAGKTAAVKAAIVVLAILAAGGGLSACAVQQNVKAAQQANPGDPIAAIKQVAVTDFKTAATMAAAATDDEHDVRAKCWADIAAWIPTVNAGTGLGGISGGASAIEQAFEINGQVSGGLPKLVPKNVHVDCAPVVLDAQQTLAALALKLGVTAGASTVVGPAAAPLLKALPIPLP